MFCEYCNDNEDNREKIIEVMDDWEDDSILLVEVVDGKLEATADNLECDPYAGVFFIEKSVKINYCPMCGRSLDKNVK